MDQGGSIFVIDAGAAMKTHLMLAGAVIAACALPVVAQSGAGSPDTLGALLGEVRALRIAIERATSTTPQIQLLAARLTVQNERLMRATQDVDVVRKEISELEGQQTMFATQSAALEEQLGREAEPKVQQELKVQQRALKEQADNVAAAEARVRAREAELSSALSVEQNQWAELNRRLDELERQLAARRPQ
jgi:chromosome segregation ATPase